MFGNSDHRHVPNNGRNKQDGKAAATEDTVHENEDEAVRGSACFYSQPSTDRDGWISMSLRLD